LTDIRHKRRAGNITAEDFSDLKVGEMVLDVNAGKIYFVQSITTQPSDTKGNQIWQFNASTSISLAFSISGMTFNRYGDHLIGDGEWRSGSELIFSSITYANGPPTSAYVSCSAWDENLDLADPWTGATGGDDQDTEYPDDVGDTLDFILNASKSSESDTFTRTATFLNQHCTGTSTAESLDSAGINGLSSKVVTSGKNGTFTFSPSANEYIYIAYRKSLGTSTFTVGGVGVILEGPETVEAHANSAGFTEPYFVYRSTNHSLATTTIVVS